MVKKDKNALLHDIQVYGFALVETNLFLAPIPGIRERSHATRNTTTC